MIAVLMLALLGQTNDDRPSPIETEVPQPALTSSLTAMMPETVASVTLKQLLDAADKGNLDRRISIEQRRRSELEVKQAWTALIPTLAVQASWTHNQYDSVLPAGRLGMGSPEVTLVPSDQLDAAARVDLPLIDAQKWMRTAVAEASRDAAIAREMLTGDQVKRAVISAWYGYAGALALKVSAVRSVQASEAQMKLQEIRERAGATTELELLRARAEVERNRQSVADAIRLIAISRRSLQSLTGVDPGEAARLPPVNLRPGASLVELESHVDQLPAIRAAQQDQKAAEKVATAAKLALVPLIGAQFTERLTNAAGFTGQSNSFNLGVNLQWRIDVPTFVGFDIQAENVAIAALAVDKQRLIAKDQINTDWQTLQAALTKVIAAQVQVEAVKRARDVAETRYSVGASTQIDVIQADRDLFGAEVQQIQAQSDLASARVALLISAGLPIETP